MTILTSELSKDVISIQKHLRHMLSRTIRKEYTLSLTHEGPRVQTTCLEHHYFTNARITLLMRANTSFLRGLI